MTNVLGSRILPRAHAAFPVAGPLDVLGGAQHRLESLDMVAGLLEFGPNLLSKRVRLSRFGLHVFALFPVVREPRLGIDRVSLLSGEPFPQLVEDVEILPQLSEDNEYFSLRANAVVED